MSYLHDLLSSCFEAEGCSDPDKAARVAVETLLKVRIITPAEARRIEMDAKVYELAKGMTMALVAERMEVSRIGAYKMLHRHRCRMRAVIIKVA